jgi:hypothetical protein
MLLPAVKQRGARMNMKRLAIGSIVGAVVIYIMGIVIWGMLFTDFFAANAGSAEGVPREAEILWAVGLGTLLYAAMVTLTLEARSGTASLMEGLKAGALVGFLLWGTADFILYGNFNLFNLNGTIADVVLEAIRGGIGGAAIGLVLSKIGD